MAEHFPGGELAFDSCNERGAKLMRPDMDRGLKKDPG